MLEVEFNSDDVCISCYDKEHTTVKVRINREKNKENIVSFNLCKKCLNQLAREFYSYS